MGLLKKLGHSIRKLVRNPKKWGRSLIHDPGALAVGGAVLGAATGGLGLLPASLSSTATSGVAASLASTGTGALAGATAGKAAVDMADPKGTAAYRAAQAAARRAARLDRENAALAYGPLAEEAARRRRGLMGRSLLRSSFGGNSALGGSGAGRTNRLGV